MGGIVSSTRKVSLAATAVNLSSQTIASSQVSNIRAQASQAALEAQAQAADAQQQAQTQLDDAQAQASQAALEAQAQAADAQQQAQTQLDDAQAQASQAALEAQAQAADAQQQAQPHLEIESSVDSSSIQPSVPRLKVQLQQALDADAQLESSLPSSRVKDALLTHLVAAAVLDTTALEATKVDEISAAVDAGLENIDMIADNATLVPHELSPRVVEAYDYFLAQITTSSLPDTLDHIDFQALDLSALNIDSVAEIQEFHAGVLSEHIEHTTLLELSESDVESMLFG